MCKSDTFKLIYLAIFPSLKYISAGLILKYICLHTIFYVLAQAMVGFMYRPAIMMIIVLVFGLKQTWDTAKNIRLMQYVFTREILRANDCYTKNILDFYKFRKRFGPFYMVIVELCRSFDKNEYKTVLTVTHGTPS